MNAQPLVLIWLDVVNVIVFYHPGIEQNLFPYFRGLFFGHNIAYILYQFYQV